MATRGDNAKRVGQHVAAHGPHRAPIASGNRNVVVMGADATPPESNATPVKICGTKKACDQRIA